MKYNIAFRSLVLAIIFTLPACGDGSKNDTDYIALGGSDVVGVGATPVTNGYVYLIEEGLEQQTGKKIDLDNLGIPGAEIAEIDNLEVQLLKLDKPNLITLTTGVNDLVDGDPADGFESDLQGLLGKLRSISPDAIIAIGNVPNLVQTERFINNPDADVTIARIQAYNAGIARQAAAFNALLVDLYSVPITDALTSEADGYHPNDAGHRVIADKFLEVLRPRAGEIVRD